MKSIAIAFRDVKILIRDRTALLILIAMPLTIIAILGMALGGMWNGDAAINKFDVAVIDRDGGSVARSFTVDILGNKEMKKILAVTTPTEAEARRKVSNGDLAAVVIIPKGFTDMVLAGKSAELKVLGDPGQQLRAGIVRSIAESFTNHVSSVMIAVKSSVESIAASGAVPPQQLAALAAEISKEAQAAQQNPQIKIAKKSTAEEKSVNAMQYYSAGMGVMFILFGSMFGAFSLLDERRQVTLARMMAAPAAKAEILAGKLGGVFLIGVIQFAVLVVTTMLLFRVDWGNSPVGVIMLTFTTVFAATGMAIFIAAVTRTQNSAAGLAQGLIQGMAALGGSMMPLAVMPKFMQSAGKFTINYWAISGFNDLMLGRGAGDVAVNCLILSGFGLAFMALGVWRFKYE